jgi:ElaB/YqjD/DUF883 family membrane-anchored ribosome-binding protein
MSDSINEGRDVAGVLDAKGEPIKDLCTQVQDYVREKPLTAALIMLGVGFMVGRFRLII